MTTAVIVAAGQGTRMGPNIDKLFLEVAGAPVVAHTWRHFDQAGFSEIIVVVRPGMEDAFAALARTLDLRTPWQTVPGGRERQDSVWNGINRVKPGCAWLAIQDGARPCTSRELIQNCLAAAHRTGASVAAQPAVDTMKESLDGRHISRHLDRSRLWSVQTPQCFQADILRRALEKVRSAGISVTDDTAACEGIGQAVELVPSTRPNPKVTTPADLPWIEYLLSRGELTQPGTSGRDDRI